MCIKAVGETLSLTGELTKLHDGYAVAVVQDGRDGTVVDHVPRNVSQVISFFLKKDRSVGNCKVTGKSISCRAGLGLEIPCVYKSCRCQCYAIFGRLKSLLS